MNIRIISTIQYFLIRHSQLSTISIFLQRLIIIQIYSYPFCVFCAVSKERSSIHFLICGFYRMIFETFNYWWIGLIFSRCIKSIKILQVKFQLWCTCMLVFDSGSSKVFKVAFQLCWHTFYLNVLIYFHCFTFIAILYLQTYRTRVFVCYFVLFNFLLLQLGIVKTQSVKILLRIIVVSSSNIYFESRFFEWTKVIKFFSCQI